MDPILMKYKCIEEDILRSLKHSGIEHRTKANTGLWLGPLIGLSAAITLLREDSYSETCLIVGVTGFGLVICSICVYLTLVLVKTNVRDFQAMYFVPAITMSIYYLYNANKGLIVSAVWGITVGSLGTWGVLQLMCTFPCCFTIGEATSVMHGGILFLISVVTNLPLRYHLPPIHNSDVVTAILQVGILYVITICLLCGYFPKLHSAIYFYPVTGTLLVCLALPCLYIVINQNPIVWVLYFVLENKRKTLLLAYWIGCLFLGTIFLAYQTFQNSHASTSARKTFHLLAVFVYIPGLIYEPTLLYLASGVIFGIFMFLELIRFLRIPPLGEALHTSFAVFVDEKDILISLTPLYLLCGLSYPLWMPTNNLPLECLISGVLAVGVGDTAASFVGSKWGRHKWPSSEKSIEGTIACILSQAGLIWILAYTGYISGGWVLLRILLACVVVSFVEARTNQVDNLALPLLMYTCMAI